MKLVKYFFLFILGAILLSSCQNSFYKRHYRNGIYLKTSKNVEVTEGSFDGNNKEKIAIILSSFDKPAVLPHKKDTNLNKKKVEYPPKTDDYSRPKESKPKNRTTYNDVYSSPAPIHNNGSNSYGGGDGTLAILLALGSCFLPGGLIMAFFAIREANRVLQNSADPQEVDKANLAKTFAIVSIAIRAVIIFIYFLVILAAMGLI